MTNSCRCLPSLHFHPLAWSKPVIVNRLYRYRYSIRFHGQMLTITEKQKQPRELRNGNRKSAAIIESQYFCEDYLSVDYPIYMSNYTFRKLTIRRIHKDANAEYYKVMNQFDAGGI